jgi:large subunit ribosomal protein L25
VQVECLPLDVPTSVDADITPLGIGESLKVSDLPTPDKAVILTSPDEVIVSVVTPQILRVEEEEAEEVAAEGAEEGEAEGEAPAEAGTGQEAAEGGESES